MEEEIKKALDIEDENPPRINLTAVICTAIVAVCATIVLCVAKPWNGSNTTLMEDTVALSTSDDVSSQNMEAKKKDSIEAARKAAEEERLAEEQRIAEEKRLAEEKASEELQKNSTLPLLKTVSTGTDNPYNGLRLVDASSRVLTSAEVDQMSKAELALARNAIYARHGYRFNNAELHEFFAKQSWFKESDVKIDAIPFTQIELDNVRLIKAREQKL